jgi:hypothetical protein
MAATTGIVLCTDVGSWFAWSGLFLALRLFRRLAKHCGTVSPQKTSCRGLHISWEKAAPVLSARIDWHSSFNWLRNYASGTIRKLERWRLICICLRMLYWSG